MRLLHHEEHFFAIDKPAGYFVHPPENSPYPVPREKICLYLLRELFQQEVFPVHRLDAPTQGVVLFAKSRKAAGDLGRLFMERSVEKTYHAVARGYLPSEGQIDLPLEIAGFADPMPSLTIYKTLAQREFPVAVGKKYPTARYSLLEVKPVTGRWHQIRRHLDRIAHPLLGDIEHGDSHHNRFFRDELGLAGLCLKATQLAFRHPWNGERVEIASPTDARWAALYRVFNFSEAKEAL